MDVIVIVTQYHKIDKNNTTTVRRVHELVHEPWVI